MTAHKYDKVLDWELATLAEEKEYCRSIEEALKKQWEQNKEKEILVKQKRAAANATLLNPRALSTSAPPNNKANPNLIHHCHFSLFLAD